jgi:hypothetical protein
MFADHFLGQIALDALRTEIPVGHASIRSEHVDGVVRDALHQQAELLLTLLEDFFGHFTIGQITGDLGKSQQFSRRVNNRINHHVGPEVRAVLAYAPAFAFESPFVNRRVQRPLGQTGTAVLIGVEAREMLAEISASSYPLKRLAPAFQLVMMPSGSIM